MTDTVTRGSKVSVRLSKRSKAPVAGEVVDIIVRASGGKLGTFAWVWVPSAGYQKLYPLSEVHPYGVTD